MYVYGIFELKACSIKISVFQLNIFNRNVNYPVLKIFLYFILYFILFYILFYLILLEMF